MLPGCFLEPIAKVALEVGPLGAREIEHPYPRAIRRVREADQQLHTLGTAVRRGNADDLNVGIGVVRGNGAAEVGDGRSVEEHGEGLLPLAATAAALPQPKRAPGSSSRVEVSHVIYR